MNELVSIIMPAYNCANYIAESINSVIGQSYKNWELIIQDDGSTDNTHNIIIPFLSDSRIHYYKNGQNIGTALTRNAALRKAKGRWIAFLDSDDLWDPQKLTKQITFMIKNNYAFTYHEYNEIDENSQELGKHVSGIKTITPILMLACCWPGCLTVIYDQKKIGLIQIPNVIKTDDSALWLKVIRKTNCHLMKETLGKYRRRKDSLSPKSNIDKLYWHYMLLKQGLNFNIFQSIIGIIIMIIGYCIKKIFYTKVSHR